MRFHVCILCILVPVFSNVNMFPMSSLSILCIPVPVFSCQHVSNVHVQVPLHLFMCPHCPDIVE